MCHFNVGTCSRRRGGGSWQRLARHTTSFFSTRLLENWRAPFGLQMLKRRFLAQAAFFAAASRGRERFGRTIVETHLATECPGTTPRMPGICGIECFVRTSRVNINQPMCQRIGTVDAGGQASSRLCSRRPLQG